MKFCAAFLFLCAFHAANCWTTEDLELFDLVESTPQTFYQVLGVDEKASSSDIRKAYRKLSTLLHPDRNKNENAEAEFRQIAAVADVLRNDERRKTYDLILKMGLPDWRAPIYYYRRVRNMGLFDMTIFLFCLATLGQYIFAWTAYWERKYEIEEVVLSKVRKKAKHQRKGNNAKIDEEYIVSAATSLLQKPRCQDLFPIRLFFFLIYLIKSSPSLIVSCILLLKTKKPPPVEEEEEEELPAPRVKTRKQVKPKVIPDYSNVPDYGSSPDEKSNLKNEGQEKSIKTKVEKWSLATLTESQITEFKKALKKFPVGTLQRWEKVAEQLGCSVSDVVTMVKQMKNNNQFSKAVPASLQGLTGTEKENFGCELYEEKGAKSHETYSSQNNINDSDINGYVTVDDAQGNEGLTVESDKFWKQEEQRLLEIALAKFSKDTPGRWDKISSFVSTKSKEECVERYKILVQQVKKRKGKEL